MTHVQANQPAQLEQLRNNSTVPSDENDNSAQRQLELEHLAAQATARLNDALRAINRASKAAEPRTPVELVLGSPFHPKTGRIRKPREQDSSEDETFKVESSSDEDCHIPTPECQDTAMRAGPGSEPDLTTFKRGRPPTVKSSAANTRWVSMASGRYGVNKPKCPPCARLKKKDPCNGQAPCRQCYGKGRRTPEECQEWGEGYVPKIRKRRARKAGVTKND